MKNSSQQINTYSNRSSRKKKKKKNFALMKISIKMCKIRAMRKIQNSKLHKIFNNMNESIIFYYEKENGKSKSKSDKNKQ